MNMEASLLHQVYVSLENKRFIYLDSENLYVDEKDD